MSMGEGLSEAPEGGDEALDAEADSEERSLEESDSESFSREEAADLGQLREALNSVEMRSFHSQRLANAQQATPINAGIAVADGGTPADLDANVDQVARRVRAQPDERQQWNTQRFIALFSGIGGIAGMLAAVYEIIHNAINAKSDGDENNPLPEDVREKIRALVKKWWGRSDAEYWDDLATAADKEDLALTLEDQILFMNYTIDLSPTTPWIWQSSDDIRSVVDQLRTEYSKSGSKASAMYRLVTTIRYTDPAANQAVPLPRPVAATVLRYALSYILIEPNTPPGTDVGNVTNGSST